MLRTWLAATGVSLLFGASCAIAQTQSAQLPIEHFTKHSDFGGIKLSPDGAHAAYLTGPNGRTIVAFIDVANKKMTGGVRCPEGFEIYDFDWISNTRVLFRIAERQQGMAKPTPTGELTAVDYDGKRQSLIYGYRAGTRQTGTLIKARESSYATPELITPLMKDDENILIAEHPWRLIGNGWYYDRDAKPVITMLNTYSGKKSRVGAAPLAGATLLVDRNDDVRFAIGRDPEFDLAVSWKPTPDSDWTAFTLPGFDAESVVPHRFAEDNKSVVFTAVREGESLVALYRLNLEDRKIDKVYGFEDTDVTDLVYDLSGQRVVGVVSEVEKPKVHWLDATDRAAKIYEALHRAFPDQSIRIATATRDGKLAIVFVYSDVNPGDYFLFNPVTMKADYLQSAMRWIDPAKMRPKEPFKLQARDGVTLHGYLTRPNDSGPHPLVVLPHGGPHGFRDRWDFDWEVQLLANRGYAVLQVNFRGSGGYGTQFEESGYKEWGGKMQDDITDATRWAIDNKHALADRICIFGTSYGGYAALMGVVREPTLYRCAIGAAGVYDLELMFSSADIPKFKSGKAYLETVLGTDPESLRARSPVHRAQAIQAPVLLIHGKEDWRADFNQAKKMKAALEKHNKDFEWMALTREGHGVYDEESRVEVYDRILKFLDKHLKK